MARLLLAGCASASLGILLYPTNDNLASWGPWMAYFGIRGQSEAAGLEDPGPSFLPVVCKAQVPYRQGFLAG